MFRNAVCFKGILGDWSDGKERHVTTLTVSGKFFSPPLKTEIKTKNKKYTRKVSKKTRRSMHALKFGQPDQ